MDASCGLTLRTRREGSAVVICIRGELDFATTPRLASVIESSAFDEVKLCLIDCSEVTFIDSEALKTLIKAQNELLEAGVQLRISGCSKQVMRTLGLLGLEDKLLLHIVR